MKKLNCPAYDKTCRKRGLKNNFASKCKTNIIREIDEQWDRYRRTVRARNFISPKLMIPHLTRKYICASKLPNVKMFNFS